MLTCLLVRAKTDKSVEMQIRCAFWLVAVNEMDLIALIRHLIFSGGNSVFRLTSFETFVLLNCFHFISLTTCKRDIVHENYDFKFNFK